LIPITKGCDKSVRKRKSYTTEELDAVINTAINEANVLVNEELNSTDVGANLATMIVTMLHGAKLKEILFGKEEE